MRLKYVIVTSFVVLVATTGGHRRHHDRQRRIRHRIGVEDETGNPSGDGWRETSPSSAHGVTAVRCGSIADVPAGW